MVKSQNLRLMEALDVEISERGMRTAYWTTPGSYIILSEEEKQEIDDWFSSISENEPWYASGLEGTLFEEEKQEKADVFSRISETFVMWGKWGNENVYTLGFCIDGAPACSIEEKLTLEQLKERAPDIFDLKGTLIHL